MELNGIIFPAPKLTWDHLDYVGELIWIPAKKPEGSAEVFVEKCREKVSKVDTSQPEQFAWNSREPNCGFGRKAEGDYPASLFQSQEPLFIQRYR